MVLDRKEQLSKQLTPDLLEPTVTLVRPSARVNGQNRQSRDKDPTAAAAIPTSAAETVGSSSWTGGYQPTVSGWTPDAGSLLQASPDAAPVRSKCEVEGPERIAIPRPQVQSDRPNS